MSHIDIATLWIKRKGFEDGPAELLVAWDGYSIEGNWEGWAAACKRELDAVGEDCAAKRFINLRVNDSEIEDKFAEWLSVDVQATSLLDDPAAL